MAPVLSEGGVLRNFTAPDFEAFGQTKPAAVLTSITPTSVGKGASDTTITLTGTGFVDGAVVKATGKVAA